MEPKNTNACKPSDVTGWDGKFYLSRAMQKEQVIITPIIDNESNNDKAIRLGTFSKPIKLMNVFHSTYKNNPENGSRMIPFGFFGENERYRSFFDSVDEALKPIRDKYFTPHYFEQEYKKIVKEFKDIWDGENRENRVSELQAQNPNMDEDQIDAMVDNELEKYVSEHLYKDSKIIKDAWKKKVNTTYEPLVTKRKFDNKKSGKKETSISAKLMMGFSYEKPNNDTNGTTEDAKQIKNMAYTNFTKCTVENGEKVFEPITFFDLPIYDKNIGQTEVISAVITIKMLPMTHRKDKLGARFFIREFGLVEKPPRPEIADAIDWDDDDDGLDINKETDYDKTPPPSNEKKRSFSDISDDTDDKGSPETESTTLKEIGDADFLFDDADLYE